MMTLTARPTLWRIGAAFIAAIVGLVLALAFVGTPRAAAQTERGCVYIGGGWACYGTLPPGQGPDVDRLGGANRYETAAAIATYDQDETESVVIIASSNLVDATTAGTHLHGPMLLVPHGSDNVPQVTLDAAVALNPDRVIVLGGTAAVSEQQVTTIRYAIYAGGTP
jgi:hypothetical protein